MYFVIIQYMVDIYNQFKDFKSFEVVFRNDEKELQKIFCTVKSIENNSIVLNANNQKNKNIFIAVGTALQLYIYTESGVYSSTSKVLLATPGIISTEYVITYPTNSKHSQRREFFRADIPVDFKMEISTEDSQIPSIVKSKTRNICGRGMSYFDDNTFLANISIQVELFLQEKTITTSADLVYSKPLVINGSTKFIHAFMFTDIAKKDTELIVKKCFLHQLDLRKKPI